ncbi:MAG: DUF4082 domain-containing protein [bacterium]
MGYRFTPLVNGQVMKLGGFFKGTKTLYLWDSSQNVLAAAQVSANNDWSYTAIEPITVYAGQTYTVAASIAGSGGTYRSYIKSLPRTYGSIEINASCYSSGSDRYPTTTITAHMYGQADIEFAAEK